MASYLYGMASRPASPGAQPKHGLDRIISGDERTIISKRGRPYWDVLVYSRALTDSECINYDLEFIGEEVLTDDHINAL